MAMKQEILNELSHVLAVVANGVENYTKTQRKKEMKVIRTFLVTLLGEKPSMQEIEDVLPW